MDDAQVMQAVFGQLAAVSAVLGGFVVTFLAVLATASDRRRRIGLALVLAVAAAGALVLAALGWSLFAAQAAQVTEGRGPASAIAQARLDQAFPLLQPISGFFVAGVALLLALLGLSGSLHSRRVGVATALLAFLFAIYAARIIRPFVI